MPHCLKIKMIITCRTEPLIPLQYCLNFHQLCGAKLKERTVTVLASNLAAHNECCCEKTWIWFCTLPGLSLTSWDSRAPSPYHSMTARTLQQWMARRKTTRQLEPHRRTTTPLCTPPSPTMVRAFVLSTSFSKCLHLPNFLCKKGKKKKQPTPTVGCQNNVNIDTKNMGEWGWLGGAY